MAQWVKELNTKPDDLSLVLQTTQTQSSDLRVHAAASAHHPPPHMTKCLQKFPLCHTVVI